MKPGGDGRGAARGLMESSDVLSVIVQSMKS